MKHYKKKNQEKRRKEGWEEGRRERMKKGRRTKTREEQKKERAREKKNTFCKMDTEIKMKFSFSYIMWNRARPCNLTPIILYHLLEGI